jgi:hypothetical protein
MRSVKLQVGGEPVNWAYVHPFPDNPDNVLYRLPTYKLLLIGTDEAGQTLQHSFEVIRFGVKQELTTTAQVVGLADAQSYQINTWLPNYLVGRTEPGAWKVYDNFLIHDGPDEPRSKQITYGAIGCIEVCGPGQFREMNARLFKAAGVAGNDFAANAAKVAAGNVLSVEYLSAIRPPLLNPEKL